MNKPTQIIIGLVALSTVILADGLNEYVSTYPDAKDLKEYIVVENYQNNNHDLKPNCNKIFKNECKKNHVEDDYKKYVNKGK